MCAVRRSQQRTRVVSTAGNFGSGITHDGAEGSDWGGERKLAGSWMEAAAVRAMRWAVRRVARLGVRESDPACACACVPNTPARTGRLGYLRHAIVREVEVLLDDQDALLRNQLTQIKVR